jgi:hypothetical protein
VDFDLPQSDPSDEMGHYVRRWHFGGTQTEDPRQDGERIRLLTDAQAVRKRYNPCGFLDYYGP